MCKHISVSGTHDEDGLYDSCALWKVGWWRRLLVLEVHAHADQVVGRLTDVHPVVYLRVSTSIARLSLTLKVMVFILCASISGSHYIVS